MALFLNAMLETDGITVVHDISKDDEGVEEDVRGIAKGLHEKIVPMIWHM